MSVADPLNVTVSKDIQDLLTTKERIIAHRDRIFHICFILYESYSNTSNNAMQGESKCIESWTCPVGECGENEHWNECGSSAGCGGDDFCCPAGGMDGTGWDPAWRSTTFDKSGSRSVKSLRKVFN